MYTGAGWVDGDREEETCTDDVLPRDRQSRSSFLEREDHGCQLVDLVERPQLRKTAKGIVSNPLVVGRLVDL